MLAQFIGVPLASTQPCMICYCVQPCSTCSIHSTLPHTHIPICIACMVRSLYREGGSPLGTYLSESTLWFKSWGTGYVGLAYDIIRALFVTDIRMYACTTGLLSLLWYTLTLLVFVEWMVHVLTAFSLRRNVNSVMIMTMVVYMYVVLEYQSWNYPCMVRSKERLDKTADYLSIYVSSSCADLHLCVQLSAKQQETLLAFRNRWVVVGVFAHWHWRGLGISQQVGVNPFIATLQHCGHGWFNITYVTQSQYICH